MLVATFVACFTVFYDLLNPFYGGYQVSSSVDQLYTIRLALKAEAELCLLDQEEDEDCATELLVLDTTAAAESSSSSPTTHTVVPEKTDAV
jgi:hypothetical protein